MEPRTLLRFPHRSGMTSFSHRYEGRLDLVMLPLIQAASVRTSDVSYLQRHGWDSFDEVDRRVSVHEALPATARPYTRFHSSVFSHVPLGVEQVGAPEVWSLSRGQHIKVAVIDTGIDSRHPDLRATVRGGYHVLAPGLPADDDNGHGTHIAGTIAAHRRGGLSGVAPGASVYAVKAFDHAGTAFISDLVRAIEWSIRAGMHIINMSFGMREPSRALYDAIQSAEQAGVFVIASAGNGGAREQVDAPAIFPQTIAVGALTEEAETAPFSKDGAHVDVFAPGVDIYSTRPGGGYQQLSGSSMATAHVSGVLALMLALRPQLKPEELRRIWRKIGTHTHVHATRILTDLFT